MIFRFTTHYYISHPISEFTTPSTFTMNTFEQASNVLETKLGEMEKTNKRLRQDVDELQQRVTHLEHGLSTHKISSPMDCSQPSLKETRVEPTTNLLTCDAKINTIETRKFPFFPIRLDPKYHEYADRIFTHSGYKLCYAKNNNIGALQQRQLITILRLYKNGSVKCLRVVKAHDFASNETKNMVCFTSYDNPEPFFNYDPLRDPLYSKEIRVPEHDQNEPKEQVWFEKYHHAHTLCFAADSCIRQDIAHPLFSEIMAKYVDVDSKYCRYRFFDQSIGGHGERWSGQSTDTVVYESPTKQQAAEVDSWFKLASEPDSFPIRN